ncbi:DUF11 domain-containing protein [Methylotetracoccus oryzae]|uniref:DUF11 domain-containing protein n=1 Tax=Methylotetracoccus oryzae TaxID=1919059 RepID=UPI001119845F|nr:DUF11 domain-containing protein [Methylotetracoccus oryzae]
MNTRTACRHHGDAIIQATSRTPSSQSTKPDRAPLWQFLGMALALTASNVLAVGETTLISADEAGQPGNAWSGSAVLSDDGRFVVFASDADNLVPGDTNGLTDTFLYDRGARRMTRVSVDSSGHQMNRGSGGLPAISANGRFIAFASPELDLNPNCSGCTWGIFIHDRLSHETSRLPLNPGGEVSFSLSGNGRFVVFESFADQVMAGDNNGVTDVFVHDRQSHKTTRISGDPSGGQGNGHSEFPRISADGRIVAFVSGASNLVAGDTNGNYDVFVHDRQTHQTTLVSVDSSGKQGVSGSPTHIDISADGRIVAFASTARGLVQRDWNAREDVFVHDLQTHQTSRVSVGSNGEEGNDYSTIPRLSADGRFVAFFSSATNLVSGDTNRSGDVFLHDRVTRQTTSLSINSKGEQGNSHSLSYGISGDGRFIVQHSAASNFAAGDTNGTYDVFVRDRLIDRSVTADLAVTQTVSPSPFPASSPITYNITVTNHGPDAANDVTLVDGPLKASAVPSQGTCSAGAPKVCYLGTLTAGADATVTLTLRPRSPGTTRVWNSARVNAAPVDPNPRNNKTGLHVSAAP